MKGISCKQSADKKIGIDVLPSNKLWYKMPVYFKTTLLSGKERPATLSAVIFASADLNISRGADVKASGD